MFLFFLKDVALGLYAEFNFKRIIFYFLLQGDIIILLLSLILVYEIKRWKRLTKINT